MRSKMARRELNVICRAGVLEGGAGDDDRGVEGACVIGDGGDGVGDWIDIAKGLKESYTGGNGGRSSGGSDVGGDGDGGLGVEDWLRSKCSKVSVSMVSSFFTISWICRTFVIVASG